MLRALQQWFGAPVDPELIPALADRLQGPSNLGPAELGAFFTRGFEARRAVQDHQPHHLELGETVTSMAGGWANYAGSGGTVVGTWERDDRTLDRVRELGLRLGGELEPLEI